MSNRDNALALLEKQIRKAHMAMHYAGVKGNSEEEMENLRKKAETLEWLVGYVKQIEQERDVMQKCLHGDCWCCKHEESSKCVECKYSYDVGGTKDYWEFKPEPPKEDAW